MNRSQLLRRVLASRVEGFPYPSDGLLHYWRLDESPALDESVYSDDIGSRNGTIVANDENDKSVVGKLGNAFQSDGIDDTVDFGTEDVFTADHSICFWIRAANTSTTQIIFQKRSGNNRPIYFFFQSGFIKSFTSTTTNNANNVEKSAMVTNTWYHIAVTFQEGGAKKLYVNGEEEHSITTTGTLVQTTAPMLIGDTSFPGVFTIDDILIYDRVISPSEIQTIYNYGS